MIEIKKLPQSRWKDFRDLRLEALQNEQLAFASSYEEEKKLTQDEWQQRMKHSLFAISKGKPVGMIVFIRNNKEKTRHIANIYGLYVKKEYRGQGIGNKLIESSLKILKNVNVSKITLSVNTEQKSAVKLYETYGFKIAGRLKKELKVGEEFYDEFIMDRFF